MKRKIRVVGLRKISFGSTRKVKIKVIGNRKIQAITKPFVPEGFYIPDLDEIFMSLYVPSFNPDPAPFSLITYAEISNLTNSKKSVMNYPNDVRYYYDTRFGRITASSSNPPFVPPTPSFIIEDATHFVSENNSNVWGKVQFPFHPNEIDIVKTPEGFSPSSIPPTTLDEGRINPLTYIVSMRIYDLQRNEFVLYYRPFFDISTDLGIWINDPQLGVFRVRTPYWIRKLQFLDLNTGNSQSFLDISPSTNPYDYFDIGEILDWGTHYFDISRWNQVIFLDKTIKIAGEKDNQRVSFLKDISTKIHTKFRGEERKGVYGTFYDVPFINGDVIWWETQEGITPLTSADFYTNNDKIEARIDRYKITLKRQNIRNKINATCEYYKTTWEQTLWEIPSELFSYSPDRPFFSYTWSVYKADDYYYISYFNWSNQLFYARLKDNHLLETFDKNSYTFPIGPHLYAFFLGAPLARHNGLLDFFSNYENLAENEEMERPFFFYSRTSGDGRYIKVPDSNYYVKIEKTGVNLYFILLDDNTKTKYEFEIGFKTDGNPFLLPLNPRSYLLLVKNLTNNIEAINLLIYEPSNNTLKNFYLPLHILKGIYYEYISGRIITYLYFLDLSPFFTHKVFSLDYFYATNTLTYSIYSASTNPYYLLSPTYSIYTGNQVHNRSLLSHFSGTKYVSVFDAIFENKGIAILEFSTDYTGQKFLWQSSLKYDNLPQTSISVSPSEVITPTSSTYTETLQEYSLTWSFRKRRTYTLTLHPSTQGYYPDNMP